MDIHAIIVTAAVIGIIGLVCGAALAFVAAKFAVKENPLAAAALEALPGANCGGCGFAGCADYAKAIAEKDAPLNMCAPGGAATAAKLAEITGRAALEVEPMTAVVLCGGDSSAAKRKFDYNGIAECSAANSTAGGDKTCPYGCLGYGSCVRACANGAISVVNRVAVVDPSKCGACGACVKACPRGLIKLVPKKHSFHVLCSSKDKGPAVRQYCSNGCIGCRICTKLDETGAFTADGFLAKVDYSKAPAVNEALPEKCPGHCIRKI